jgi:hypothetical protein
MAARTIFLAKLLGLYFILAGVAFAARGPAMVDTFVALFHDAPLIFIAGLFMLGAALAMVLCHNIWSGGVLPVVITLIGWVWLIKALLLLLLSPSASATLFMGTFQVAQFIYIYAATSIILGIFLAYMGFWPKSR